MKESNILKRLLWRLQCLSICCCYDERETISASHIIIIRPRGSHEAYIPSPLISRILTCVSRVSRHRSRVWYRHTLNTKTVSRSTRARVLALTFIASPLDRHSRSLKVHLTLALNFIIGVPEGHRCVLQRRAIPQTMSSRIHRFLHHLTVPLVRTDSLLRSLATPVFLLAAAATGRLLIGPPSISSLFHFGVNKRPAPAPPKAAETLRNADIRRSGLQRPEKIPLAKLSRTLGVPLVLLKTSAPTPSTKLPHHSSTATSAPTIVELPDSQQRKPICDDTSIHTRLRPPPPTFSHNSHDLFTFSPYRRLVP